MFLLKATSVSVAALACALTSACVTEGPRPTEELTRARAVIEQADKTDAQRYAAADLQKAHDELGEAEKYLGENKFDESRRYAEAAEADGNLAAARSSAAQARHAAEEVTRGNEALRHESNGGDSSTRSPQN